MNWNGQNGHMEQQDRWNWLCSLGAISLHPDPQATFYFHLSSFSCGPYCQYYDGDTHLVELSTPYSYVLSSQSTFLDGPLVYLYFCSQDSHWLFCLDETTFPILIVESSSSSSWLWWEQSVFSWQSWLTIAMWLYAIPFTTQFSCALHFAFSWWLALGWVHLSMPSSMLSMFWIFLFVAPEKSIISLWGPSSPETRLYWHFSLWKWPFYQWCYISPLSSICYHGLIWADSLHCFKIRIKHGDEEGFVNLFFPYDCGDSLLWNCHHQIFSPQSLSHCWAGQSGLCLLYHPHSHAQSPHLQPEKQRDVWSPQESIEKKNNQVSWYPLRIGEERIDLSYRRILQ